MSTFNTSMFQSIKDALAKNDNENNISRKRYNLTHEQMTELKRDALIKQCTNAQMQNYLVNEDTNFTTGIKNKASNSAAKI